MSDAACSLTYSTFLFRIAWNTLKVRDCRHCTHPKDVFREVEAHLKLATGGTNIQSVMTVFRPQQRNEMFGLRFWSEQFVRYAGYKLDGDSGEVLGDPASVDFTAYLIGANLWNPPAQKSAFDVLPVVIKFPFNDIPFVYELSKDVTHEIELEHPKYPAVKGLGYRPQYRPSVVS